MSVYRKNKNGELVKVAGSLTQRINMPMLRTEHIVENNADYYVIDPIQAALYINRLADNTYYLLYLEEANETSNVYIKLNEQSLKLASGANSVIAINTLYGRIDLFTLDASVTGTIQLAISNGTAAETSGSISEALILGIDGVIQNNRVIFEVQNAASFMPYRTNQRRFLLTGILPVVGELDLSMPVNITFGDTVYNLYSYTKGGDEPLMIGDIISNHLYDTQIGYKFVAETLFIETSDIKGFVLSPSNIVADQLTNIIDDSDTIIISLDETGSKIKLNLAASITNKLSRVLVAPLSKPSVPKLVAIGTDGMQTMLELGTGLEIVDGKLVSTVSAQLGEINQILDDINGEVV